MPDARIEIETEDGVLDAFVACPEGRGPWPPILWLADPRRPTAEVEIRARRLSAHNYFILAPDVAARAADERREAVFAALDHLADIRDVDDTRVGALGFGAGADLALGLAAWRAERVAAVAAYDVRGPNPRMAREIASRINGMIRFGYRVGVVPPRIGVLEQALCQAGVDFDIEVGGGEPDWPGLLDFFDRALRLAPGAAPATQTLPRDEGLNL